MERQFTATAYLFHEDRVLLHYHAKLKAWMPPGGHLEANETPPEAVRREVMEETGLEIEFIQNEEVLIDGPDAKSFERPFLCLLENVPAHKDKPAHQHMDFIYLAKPLQLKDDMLGFRWFRFDELEGLELLGDVRAMLQLMLKENRLANYQR